VENKTDHINSSISLLDHLNIQTDILVITTIVILKIIQDPLSIWFRHILKILLVSFWQPLDDSFALASQFHAKEIKVQVTRITFVSHNTGSFILTFQKAFLPEQQYVLHPSLSIFSPDLHRGLTKAQEATMTIIFQPIKSTRVNGRIVR
jgi:hypothetical protein